MSSVARPKNKREIILRVVDRQKGVEQAILLAVARQVAIQVDVARQVDLREITQAVVDRVRAIQVAVARQVAIQVDVARQVDLREITQVDVARQVVIDLVTLLDAVDQSATVRDAKTIR